MLKEPLPGAVQLYVTPVDGVDEATIVAVGLEQVVVTDGAAILTTGNTVFDATVILALPVQPLIVLVITTEYVPPSVTVGVATDVPDKPDAGVQLKVCELFGDALSVTEVVEHVIVVVGAILAATAVVLVGTNVVIVDAQPVKVFVTTH